jgi:hypothetical protein
MLLLEMAVLHHLGRFVQQPADMVLIRTILIVVAMVEWGLLGILMLMVAMAPATQIVLAMAASALVEHHIGGLVPLSIGLRQVPSFMWVLLARALLAVGLMTAVAETPANLG